MPYEVFSLFFRCSEIHGTHSCLKDAAACFAHLTQRYGDDLRVDPISQKYVHEIAAIDRNGNQRDFSKSERDKAASLNLDPKAVATEVPGITTFSHLARMYNEASRLIPVTDINLKGMFDYHGGNRHFWNTDAGKGQALAYAQQAAFTLELALKAYLEVLSILGSTDRGDPRQWRTHELTDLFNFLTDDKKNQLEEWWNHWDAKSIHSKSSFRRIPFSQQQTLRKVAIHHRPQISRPLDRDTDAVERLRLPLVCFGPGVQKKITNQGQHHHDNTPK